jgi:hypothetical protein
MLARCYAAFAYTLEKRRNAASIGDRWWTHYALKPKRSGGGSRPSSEAASNAISGFIGSDIAIALRSK